MTVSGAARLNPAGRLNELAAQSRSGATRGLAQDVCPCIDRLLRIFHAMSIGLSGTTRQPGHRQPVILSETSSISSFKWSEANRETSND